MYIYIYIYKGKKKKTIKLVGKNNIVSNKIEKNHKIRRYLKDVIYIYRRICSKFNID